MKVSQKTMEKMLAAGIIAGTAIGWKAVFVDRPRDCAEDLSPPARQEVEYDPDKKSFRQTYYEKKRAAYYWAVGKGLLPPPPPCPMCGAG